jgi:hypothetical protein
LLLDFGIQTSKKTTKQRTERITEHEHFYQEKPLSDGRKFVYLEYYVNGKRKYEFLSLYLTLAENIRTKRDLEMQHFDLDEPRRSTTRAFFARSLRWMIRTGAPWRMMANALSKLWLIVHKALR